MKSATERLLDAIKSGEHRNNEPTLDSRTAAALLRNHYAQLVTKYTFTEGMLVEDKPGNENKKAPRGGVAIVTRLLATPVMGGDADSGSPYFNESLDMVIGQLSADRMLMEYHVDSRRYQPYTGPVPLTN